MIKYIIVAIALLAGCDRDCDAPGRPQYPEIGGCITGAVAGEAGGYCLAGAWGAPYYCSEPDLACVDGTCYSCGHLGEPCCGGQAAADSGTCEEGNCAMPPGEEWYTCQGDATPPSPGCGPGDKPNYYVWVLSSICEAASLSFCAIDAADAQAYVDANLAGVQHGPIGTDPNSVMPKLWYACGSGDNCIVGSSDGALATTFNAFTHDQVVACEAALDAGCAWVDTPNDTCPAQ